MQTFKKYLKHPGIWINALLGRSLPIEIPDHQVTYQTPDASHQQTPGVAPSTPTQNTNIEDPLYGDLQKATSLLKRLTGSFRKVSQPLVEQAGQATSNITTNTNEFVKTDRFKKIVPILIFVVVLGIITAVISYLGISFYKNMTGKKDTSVSVVFTPSPTPIEFEPSIPSVYANEPEVLMLEADTNVLDREIVGAQLRETTLNPPVLDFNISF